VGSQLEGELLILAISHAFSAIAPAGSAVSLFLIVFRPLSIIIYCLRVLGTRHEVSE